MWKKSVGCTLFVLHALVAGLVHAGSWTRHGGELSKNSLTEAESASSVTKSRKAPLIQIGDFFMDESSFTGQEERVSTQASPGVPRRQSNTGLRDSPTFKRLSLKLPHLDQELLSRKRQETAGALDVEGSQPAVELPVLPDDHKDLKRLAGLLISRKALDVEGSQPAEELVSPHTPPHIARRHSTVDVKVKDSLEGVKPYFPTRQEERVSSHPSPRFARRHSTELFEHPMFQNLRAQSSKAGSKKETPVPKD